MKLINYELLDFSQFNCKKLAEKVKLLKKKPTKKEVQEITRLSAKNVFHQIYNELVEGIQFDNDDSSADLTRIKTYYIQRTLSKVYATLYGSPDTSSTKSETKNNSSIWENKKQKQLKPSKVVSSKQKHVRKKERFSRTPIKENKISHRSKKETEERKEKSANLSNSTVRRVSSRTVKPVQKLYDITKLLSPVQQKTSTVKVTKSKKSVKRKKVKDDYDAEREYSSLDESIEIELPKKKAKKGPCNQEEMRDFLKKKQENEKYVSEIMKEVKKFQENGFDSDEEPENVEKNSRCHLS